MNDGFKRYWEEAHVTVDTVLASSRQQGYNYLGHVTRLFVINVIDRFLRTRYIKWRGACVVDQSGIELSEFKLIKPMCPLLFQVMSRYWPYDRFHYYPVDDIYEAVTMWMWLLWDRYDGKLFGKDMRQYIKPILFG